MRSAIIVGGLLASVLAMPAFAQSSATSSTPAVTAAKPASANVARVSANQWRSSKLIGVNVYNDQNEKLGDISDIILDKSGKVDGVVIGVGGFLGMGQHDIMVSMDKLKFFDEPAPRTSSTAPASTTGASNRTATTESSSSGKRWYPDHAVLAGASKDQLKAMPQFKY